MQPLSVRVRAQCHLHSFLSSLAVPGKTLSLAAFSTKQGLCRRYRTITHPGAMNPFPHSLLDYTSCIQLKDVTLVNHTFLEWESEFDTDSNVRPICYLAYALGSHS